MQILVLFLATIAIQNVLAARSAYQFVSCLKSQFPKPSDPISKVVFTPENAAFNATLQAYIQNSRFNRSTTPRPVAIVAPTNYSHVQSAVFCSGVSGIQLRIRSGGHDNEGMSYVSPDPFAVLDMFNLREVRVDVEGEVAWVQSGAILGELYYSVAKKSNNTLAFPAGVCLTLGAGGHITGAGYGAMMRKYGLSSDNVLDAEVVDANGKILNRKTMGEDVFWAIRGGGAASFAVVLSWKLRLVRVPETVTVFSVKRMVEEGATDVIDQWQRVAYKADPNLFIRAQPQATVATPGNKTTVGVTFIGLYLGGAKEMLTLVNATFPLLGLKPEDCAQMSWLQSNLFWADLPKDTPVEHMLTRSSRPNNYHKNKSDYVKSFIPKNGWEAIWKKLIEVGPSMRMQYNPYGGRMGEIAEDATPFPHRAGNLFKMQYIMFWQDPSLEADDKYVRATRDLYDAFAPFVSQKPREAYLNYRDIDVGTNADGQLVFAYDFFKGNVERLLKVKAQVDPQNLFRYEQSIPLIKK
ncbi:hypothetical protein V2J09_011189 [Rumex salicifolius]